MICRSRSSSDWRLCSRSTMRWAVASALAALIRCSFSGSLFLAQPGSASVPIIDLARQPGIRIAFDEKKKQVLFKAWPPLGGASYSLLDQLPTEYAQSKHAGLAPENYPFVDGHKLAQRLEIDEPTVRARISRLRRRLEKNAIAAGHGFLATDALIENEAWSRVLQRRQRIDRFAGSGRGRY